jgi:hypothetical protein
MREVHLLHAGRAWPAACAKTAIFCDAFCRMCSPRPPPAGRWQARKQAAHRMHATQRIVPATPTCPAGCGWQILYAALWLLPPAP